MWPVLTFLHLVINKATTLFWLAAGGPLSTPQITVSSMKRAFCCTLKAAMLGKLQCWILFCRFWTLNVLLQWANIPVFILWACVGVCVCVCARARVFVCVSVDLSALHISVLAQCCYVLHRQSLAHSGRRVQGRVNTVWARRDAVPGTDAHTHTHTKTHPQTHTHTHTHTLDRQPWESQPKQNRMYIKEVASPPLFSLFLSLHPPS